MVSGVRIVLEGLPERVQWIADELDQVLGGRLVWREVAEPGVGPLISIVGAVAPSTQDLTSRTEALLASLADTASEENSARPKLCRSLTAATADGPASFGL